MRQIEFQGEQFADYLNFERGLSPLTVSAYGRELEKFITFATARGRHDPLSVGADDVRDYVFHLSDLGLASTSVRRAQSALRTYFGFLLEEGRFKKRPDGGASKPTCRAAASKRPRCRRRVCTVGGASIGFPCPLARPGDSGISLRHGGARLGARGPAPYRSRSTGGIMHGLREGREGAHGSARGPGVCGSFPLPPRGEASPGEG